MNRQKVQKLVEEIDQLVDHDFDDLQDWVSMEAWPVGETRKINGTLNTKIFQDDKLMRFLTCLPPGTKFAKHWHDIAESCRVLAGLLKCLLSGRTWKRDELAVFSRGQKHIPHNPSDQGDTWLEVNFYR